MPVPQRKNPLGRETFMDPETRVTEAEALEMHASGRPGKIEITPTKPLTTQRDLSLAYSPGVAWPCLAIHKDPDKAYDYTANGNLVAVICDTKGVVYQGRTDGMNQWKSAHAVPTKARTLAEAVKGADVVFGLSAKGAISQAMVKSMAAKPIIFAMANPDPEITPEDVRAV